MNPIKKDFYILVAATIALYIGLLTIGVIGWVQNNHRTNDIQVSRIYSCKQNYEGIRQVFKPFFPHKPRTAHSEEQIRKFNTTIDELKAKCSKQVKP